MLHSEFFNRETTDPLAPTRLEVIDRATEEALQRLMEVGLIAKADRAARPLDQDDDANSAGALSAEEQERLRGLQEQAKRKLKMIRLLTAGGLEEEARASVGEAVLLTARALAVRHRSPEPASLQEALQPPLSLLWKDGGVPVREFLESEGAAISPMMEYLELAIALLGEGVTATAPAG